jgi:isocitrate dehydrogenase
VHFKPADYRAGAYAKIECYGGRPKVKSKKELIGVDVFIDNPTDIPAEELAKKLASFGGPTELIVLTSRGLKIWPNSSIDAPYVRHCCCRFQSSNDVKNLKSIKHTDIIELLAQFEKAGLDVIKTENLYTFDGQLGFTLAQGQ